MALSDDCSEFVDYLRPRLEHMRECIQEYHGEPWCYDRELLADVSKAADDIQQALSLLEAVRQELDTSPDWKPI